MWGHARRARGCKSKTPTGSFVLVACKLQVEGYPKTQRRLWRLKFCFVFWPDNLPTHTGKGLPKTEQHHPPRWPSSQKIQESVGICHGRGPSKWPSTVASPIWALGHTSAWWPLWGMMPCRASPHGFAQWEEDMPWHVSQEPVTVEKSSSESESLPATTGYYRPACFWLASLLLISLSRTAQRTPKQTPPFINSVEIQPTPQIVLLLQCRSPPPWRQRSRTYGSGKVC